MNLLTLSSPSLPVCYPPLPCQANMEHKEFEAELKKRRKDFSEDLEMYAAQVEAFHSIGATDIVRRDQVRGGSGEEAGVR